MREVQSNYICPICAKKVPEFISAWYNKKRQRVAEGEGEPMYTPVSLYGSVKHAESYCSAAHSLQRHEALQ